MVEVRDDGSVGLHGLTSTSTRVNGETVASRSLEIGDIVSLGDVLVRLQRDEPLASVPTCPDLAGSGSTHAALVRALERAARDHGSVELFGEPGSGRHQWTTALHRRRRRPGRLVVLHRGADRSARPDSERLDDAAGGTVLLRGLDGLPPPERARMLATISQRAATLDADLVVSSSRPSTHAPWTSATHRVDIPPLRDRREDIPAIAAHLVRRHLGRPVALRPASTLEIMRYEWPGNIAELEASIRRAAARDPGHGALRLPNPFETPWPIAAPQPSASAGVLQLGPTWFRPPGATVVELKRRRVICRVYGALYERRLTRPGEPVLLGELLAEGWPGERVLARSGANRVYVALTTLRKLGLRGAIIRTKRGYLLDPELEVGAEAAAA